MRRHAFTPLRPRMRDAARAGWLGHVVSSSKAGTRAAGFRRYATSGPRQSRRSATEAGTGGASGMRSHALFNVAPGLRALRGDEHDRTRRARLRVPGRLEQPGSRQPLGLGLQSWSRTAASTRRARVRRTSTELPGWRW